MTDDRTRWRDRIIGVTPFGLPSARLAVAVARAGGLGALDLGRDREAALAALEQTTRWWDGPFAVRVAADCPLRPEELPGQARTLLVDAPALEAAEPYMPGRRLIVEVVDQEEAHTAVRLGADGLVARGCEAGGRIGELTTFVLLQCLLGDPVPARPIWAAGGIGPHTAAAAVAGGAHGVVLDAQLALVRELDLPAEVAAAIRAMDGGQTRVVAGHRVYTRPDLPALDLTEAGLGATDLRTGLLPVGQDGALARPLAERHKTAGGIVQAVADQIEHHLAAAVRAEPLAPVDAPEGRAYPVLQGPMTRVSDCATFAAAVAQDGGVPFLALALMSGAQTRTLLADTAERLGDRPWGVGLLGFAPPEVRAAQLEAVRAAKPPFALIAGGRPDQAMPLEEAGVATYLHVPSPGLLDRFLAQGVRRFVFEGMECGGHVGPRAGFPLWETQVERLLAFTDEHPGDAAELSVAFAGGIHDERSAAMVAALAGPLAERGAQIRVLMGTAYLFTHEAVAAGAIVPGYQQTAIQCRRTVLLETSPGHATRCASTPYVEAFEQARQDLQAAGTDTRDMWAKLERLNLGRLRLAGKGVRRQGERLLEADEIEQYGEGMFMIGQVAGLRSDGTTIAELHEQVSAGATAMLAERVQALRRRDADEHAGPAPRPLDIAIVGVGCAFPGARDAGRYWANIVAGVDAVTEVPPERWNPDVYWDPESRSADKTPSKWGGFLPDIPFDALAHGIPPNSLGSVDPVQLLALEVASRALADAGYADRPFDRSRAAVIFGAEGVADLGNAYGTRATLPQYYGQVPPALDERLPRVTEDSFPGVLSNVIAGRIANRLDLGGANYTVNAACAASLAALDAACKELTCGAADMVLCGGADVHNGPYDYLMFSAVRALSPSGRCAPFDSGADGIALGEGVACVVLKRLADAERDGDRVHAVIKSVGSASDGRSLGLTAPRADGQRLALERAYRDAGIAPSQVGLIEAHGTGTVVGDRTELATLTRVFSAAEPGRIVLGSVKSQIGHTKCAAGLAGLIKTVYALHTGVRPGTLHLRSPAPEWDAETSPFCFSAAARPWAVEPGERYAGVSGFGFGGANFHTVLAGYGGAPEPVSGLAEWPAELFVIRGADRAAAREVLDRLAAHGPGARLRDLARTVAGPSRLPVQVAFVATSGEDLAAKIKQAREFRPAPGVFPASDAERGQVAFLFPGQGSQRPGMLAELFIAFPRLQRLLRLGHRYAEAMFPPAAFTDEERRRQRTALTDTRIAQPALGIAGLAMHRLLTELGVRPDMAAGHSYGELVALCAAGVFGETDLLELSAARAEAILRAVGEDPGTMAAVAATLEEVREAIDAVPGVVAANHNAPRQVVISGPTSAVEEAVRVLAERGVAAERIPVACAFHSPLAASAAVTLSVELAGRKLCSPAFPVWSNAQAAPYDSMPQRLADTLAEQVAVPVRFVDQIEAMYDAGARVFVEAGPGRVLTRLVGRILDDRPHTVVACDHPSEGLAGLLLALAELAAAGVEVDPLPLFNGRDAEALPDTPRPRPGWIVNGHLVRTADGGYPEGGLRPAERIGEPLVQDRDSAVLEYLRTTRELVAAQRDVVLGYLGTRPEPPRKEPPRIPRPRPVPKDDAPQPTSVREQVLNVISARTGYPREMLATGLDLEADLSIDSIKRTEIIGDLADRVGLATPGEPVVERLARIKTIDEMVTWLDGHLEHRGSDTQPMRVVARAVAEAVPPRRHLVRLSGLAALPSPEPGALAGRRCLVVDDGRGIAPHLAALLETYGGQARIAENVAGPADAVVHLAALRPGWPPVLPGVYAGIRDALLGGTRHLLLVTGSGGAFGHRGSGDVSAGAGLCGLARTLALEYPDVLIKAVDVDPGDDPAKLAERLVAELLGEGPVVVGHEGATRHTPTLLAEDLTEDAPLQLERDGVVLLTGGARGITARIAHALAATTGCHLELIGRTALSQEAELADAPDEISLRRILARQTGRSPADIEATARRIMAEREVRDTIARLEPLAASVRYHRLDVGDPQAVRAAVEAVYARRRRIDGVIHGAGVLDDRLVRDKDPEAFARVYRTKASAARALAEVVRPDVGFFVVLGSVAGVLGNRGQADYAAANDACDTLARLWRTRLRGRVLVADWGPWAGGGMVTPELAREYARRGIPLLDPDSAVAALLREIAAGTELQVVFTGGET